MFGLLILLVSNAIGQVKVSGVVVDEQGMPIPFVNVVFVGTTIGTTTNDQGEFQLKKMEGKQMFP